MELLQAGSLRTRRPGPRGGIETRRTFVNTENRKNKQEGDPDLDSDPNPPDPDSDPDPDQDPDQDSDPDPGPDLPRGQRRSRKPYVEEEGKTGVNSCQTPLLYSPSDMKDEDLLLWKEEDSVTSPSPSSLFVIPLFLLLLLLIGSWWGK